MQNATLLNTLRGEVFTDQETPTPATQRQAEFDPAMLSFSTLPDAPRFAQMERVFSDGTFENFYFTPRGGRIRAEVESGGQTYVTFSGYNYLGLSDDQRVIDAAQQALEQYGTHAGAARMVGGEIDLHRELEQTIAGFCGHEDAVVAVGGYGTNVSVLGYLMGKKDLIVHDAFVHNSAVLGAVLSGARRMSFEHGDYDALEQILREHRGSYERVVVVAEGAYSMDGDVVDLPRLVEIKQRYGAWLMIDEAHSYGVLGKTGRGVAEHFGITPSAVDISMGTLSKSFASCGGFIAGSRELVSLLRAFAPGMLLYSTGISPANTAAALAAVRILEQEPERLAYLRGNAQEFCVLAKARGLDIGTADGQVPIVPVIIGGDMLALEVASDLFRNGTIAHPILYPVVPSGQARIRFFLTAGHTTAQMVATLDRIEAAL